MAKFISTPVATLLTSNLTLSDKSYFTQYVSETYMLTLRGEKHFDEIREHSLQLNFKGATIPTFIVFEGELFEFNPKHKLNDANWAWYEPKILETEEFENPYDSMIAFNAI